MKMACLGIINFTIIVCIIYNENKSSQILYLPFYFFENVDN